MGYDFYSNRIRQKPKKELEKRFHKAFELAKKEIDSDDPKDIMIAVDLAWQSIQYPYSNQMRFSIHYWPIILRVASIYGWQSEQPLKNYLNNNSLVKDDDARGLASALEKALPDIPDERQEHEEPAFQALKENDDPFENVLKMFAISNEERANKDYSIWLSGNAKDKLIKFIDFCKHGEFAIS